MTHAEPPAPAHAPVPYAPTSPPYGPPVWSYAPQPGPSFEGLSVASLVIGIVAVVLTPLVAIVSGVLAGGLAGMLAIGAFTGVGLGVWGLHRVLVRRETTGEGTAIAGVATSATALLLIVALLPSASSTPARERTESTASSAPGDSAPGDNAPWGSTDGSPTPEQMVDLPKKALTLGTSARVGDFTVTVTGIDLHADAAIEAVDPRNPPAFGRYVEAALTVVYTGSTHGNPRDLLVAYVGSEWLYDEWGCLARTADPVADVGAMLPGETVDYSVCLDVDPDAVDGRSVVVEDLTAKHFTSELWSADLTSWS